MRLDESLVVHAFCAWLRADGWTANTEVNYVDVVAERDGERLYAEAKGETTGPGLDVNTAYGQLLSRMPAEPELGARYALVVPDEPKSVRAVARVPQRILDLLDIRLYAVARDGAVREVAGRLPS